MRGRIITALLVVALGAGMFATAFHGGEKPAIATLDALDAFAEANSRLDRSAMMVYASVAQSYQPAQVAISDMHNALGKIEATLAPGESIDALRKIVETKSARLNILLGFAANARTARIAAAQLFEQNSAPKEEREPWMQAWRLYSLVPSEENVERFHESLRQRHTSTEQSTGMLRFALLVAQNERAAKRSIDVFFAVPVSKTVHEMRATAQRRAHVESIKRRWITICVILFVGALSYSVWRLVARLEMSHQSIRKLNDSLESQVAARTAELVDANQQLAEDIARREAVERDRDAMEVELRHAQKLEAVGRLAAGIAHEINTPTQYVSDNVRFLSDTFDELISGLHDIDSGLNAAEVRIETLRETITQMDLDYLEKETPLAIKQSIDGLQRIATIVSAMKQFSHPSTEKTLNDLNGAITSTVSVARNEWKYVAELTTDLDPELPAVSCVLGELNQVFLNMIVNSSHAIADVIDEASGEKGTIHIATRAEDDHVIITVSDTGGGIPDDIQSQVFDPFFTTKEVGKGTGQGLSIARSVIVDKHGGLIDLDSEPGKGTTFIIRLPLTSPSDDTANEASADPLELSPA